MVYFMSRSALVKRVKNEINESVDMFVVSCFELCVLIVVTPI